MHHYDPAYFETIMIYLLGSRDDVPFEILKKELTDEGRKRLMSIADKLRYEGMKEGKEEGKYERSREIPKKLLLLNLDKKQIIEATDLSAEEIERIKKELS